MMFDQLSGQLSGAMRKLSGQATITDKNIESALKDVRRSLLEADVNLEVASGLVSDIRKRAIGMAVVEGVTPAQQFIKIMSVRKHIK
jgi:signal recognition particle subunit SRP54